MFTQFIFMQILGDKLDPRKMYFVGSIFSSLAFFSFTLVSNFIQIVGTQIILGFSWSLFYVGGLRSVEENSKKSNAVATATGLYNSSISIAQIVSPFIALLFLRFSDSFVNTMLFAAIITILAGAFYGLIELYPPKSNAISS